MSSNSSNDWIYLEYSDLPEKDREIFSAASITPCLGYMPRKDYTEQLAEAYRIYKKKKSVPPKMKAAVDPYSLRFRLSVEKKPIVSFREEYSFLSNSYATPIKYDDLSYTKSYIKRVKMTLESIFKTAKENGYISQSPCTGIIWEGVKTGTHKVVSKEIDDLLLNNWMVHKAGIWAMLIRYAGLRPSEAFALDRSCITKDKIIVRNGSHFEHGQLVITEGVTKSTAGQREIPILPPLEPVIEQMPKEGLVCLSTAGEIMTQSASRRNWVSFMRMLEDAYNGIAPRKARRTDRLPENWKWLPKFTPYDLRHSFCSMLYDADVDVKTAQYLMGHSDLNMTLKIYTHLSEQKKMLSYGKLFSLFESETNGCQNGCQEVQKAP